MRRVRIVKADSAPVESSILELNSHKIEYYDDYSIIEDEKRLYKFVKAVKSYIRGSYEYKRLMKFLKEERDMDRCGTHYNLTRDDGFNINIHHAPTTISDLIYTVIYKRAKLNESLKMTAIAKEVMYLHYLGLIGLYPLCETCHEFTHSDDVDDFIPFNKLYGDPEGFFEVYQEFMSIELVNKFRNMIEVNKAYNVIEEYVPVQLMKSYIYIQDEKTGAEFISVDKLLDFINTI